MPKLVPKVIVLNPNTLTKHWQRAQRQAGWRALHSYPIPGGSVQEKLATRLYERHVFRNCLRASMQELGIKPAQRHAIETKFVRFYSTYYGRKGHPNKHEVEALGSRLGKLVHSKRTATALINTVFISVNHTLR